jgi:glycosyltransferase involved in cell wall biosynthesis
LDRLLKAAAIIRNEMLEQDIHITILGADQGGNRIKLQKMIDENKLSKVVTLGDAIYGKAKVKKILSNDCFIQLSRTEGQPLSVIEALDIGMPCIVTEGTTFREIVKENEAGIPVGDEPELIAKTILSIRAGDYDLGKISSNASNYASSHFDWMHLGSEMINDYKDAMRMNRS